MVFATKILTYRMQIVQFNLDISQDKMEDVITMIVDVNLYCLQIQILHVYVVKKVLPLKIKHANEIYAFNKELMAYVNKHLLVILLLVQINFKNYPLAV